MKRRTFLSSLARASIAGVALNRSVFGNDPSKFGLQLYTVRKHMTGSFEETLRKVSELGVREVEFAGYFNRSATQIKEILSKFALSAPSAHLGLDALQGKLSSAIADAKILGHKYLVVPSMLPKDRKSLDGYKKFADFLNSAGRECREAGLQLAYHNHDFEFEEMNGRIPFDLLLSETDSREVKFELDLYWITKAGFDALRYFEDHPGRFPLVHVKDMDNTPRKTFTEVGSGVIDFKKIFKKAGRAGIKHYFIEQDVTPGEPLESVRISLEYLHRERL